VGFASWHGEGSTCVQLAAFGGAVNAAEKPTHAINPSDGE